MSSREDGGFADAPHACTWRHEVLPHRKHITQDLCLDCGSPQGGAASKEEEVCSRGAAKGQVSHLGEAAEPCSFL